MPFSNTQPSEDSPNCYRSNPSQLSRLAHDFRSSQQHWRFWTYLGWNDIVKQYRRSFIGPVWISLNTAIFIIAFGLIGAQLFKLPLKEYLPYFCTGHILFSALSALVNDGCQTYISADAFLRQTPYPKLAFVFRVVWRNLLLLVHNLVIVVLVLAWSGHLAQILWLPFVAALAFTVLTATLVVAILGGLATRFRDIPLIVASVMQISFFVTPVMWRPEQLTERAQWWVVHLNPLAAFLDILRSPLLGQHASIQSWLNAWAIAALLLIVFVFLYRSIRQRIVYWL